MPVVPTARNVIDFPSPGVNARVDAPNMGAGGEMIGRALEGLGGELGNAAEVQQQIETIHDHAAVKEQINKNLSWFTEAGYTGPNAYFQKDGRDAVETQPMVTKGLDELIRQNRAALNNPRQQRMYDLAMEPMRNEWGAKIAQHGAQQEKVYDQQQSAGLQTSSAELAKAQYLNDPDAAEKQIDTGLTEVDRYWRSQGAAQPFIDAKKLEYASGIYKDVGANLANSGPDGPKLAQALVERHGGSMTADDRYAVTTHARVSQDMLDAKARQAEAEQRRLVEQAQRDARTRAQSVLDSVVPGIPVDPKTFASAIGDAQTAQDEGLLKRLQQVQTKNTVLFTHQHDTPIDLQNQVNALSAKIARDGTKADPSDILTRDTLQQLYNNSSEDLRSNGLAYAAQHLGMAPEPLNLMSPASIHARVQLAQRASQLTGTEVAPLQPAEVQPLTQAWRAGDAGTKTNLVMRLAQFGSMAPAAAQQIAPNDAGLVHLIGLASHSNRGVAISRVNQAIAGYEAMKTEGQIVGKIAAGALGQSRFNEWTGSALQFMPGARDGVYTVAKALLAQDAAQHGWPDENAAGSDQGEKAWYRAVNSALGAYIRDCAVVS